MIEMVNIENKMKQIVSGHHMAPPTFVWNNIESSLDNNPKTKNNLAWTIGALALLLLLSFLYWNSNKKQIPTISNEIALTIPTNNPNPKIDPNKAILAPVLIDDKLETDNKAAFIVKQQATTQNQKAFKNPTAQITKPEILADNPLINVSQKPIHTPILAESLMEIQSNELSIIPISSEVNDVQNQLTNFDLLPLKYTLLPFQFDIPKIKNQVICPSFGRKGKGINTFLELGVIMGGHNITLENESNNAETNQLLEKRKSTESNWYTWGAYLNLGINISPNFYVGTGLEYTQSKDRFNYASGTITKIIINLDENGNPIDTTFVSGINESKGEIKYSLIDIPLYFGAATNLGFFSIGAEIGAVLNISQSATGKMVTLTDEISYIQDEDIAYKTSVGLGLRASLILRKELSNGLSIQVKPGYKTYLNPISKDNYAITSKYSSFNVKIGIRRDF